MAPSRKNANGRSPLVNKQHQITSFFTKSSTKSPINSVSPKSIIPNPNPNPNIVGNSPPTTPSPLKPKPVLVIGSIKDSSIKEEVVGKRIRVYWPLDKTWYDGTIKAYDTGLGKHLIEYDDADEELIDLSKEKFELIECENRKFKRLRKVSVIVDDDDEEKDGNVGGSESLEDDDDESDEDWGKNNANVETENDDCLDAMELEDEIEVGKLKRKRGESSGARKSSRKDGGESVDLSVEKKKKDGGEIVDVSVKKKKGGFLVSEFGIKAETVVANVQGN